MIEAPVTISARAVPRMSPATMTGNMTGLFSMTGDMVASTEEEGLNSRAGDQVWAEALSASVTGLDSTWDTPIDFDSQVPTGLTVETIGGEERVTAVDIRSLTTGMGLLGGSLDIPEWENLKECVLINTAHNSFDTQYPNAIHKIGSKLKYLYLNYSDHSLESTYPGTYSQPHEYAENETPGHLDPGKDSGTGNSIFRGAVGSDINNLTSLEGYLLSFTDDFGANSRTPNTVNGIESIPSTLWDLIPTLKYVQIYDNWNIAGSGNTFSFPATFGGDRPLQQLFLGGGTGTTWDEFDQGFVVGGYPSDINQLTNITIFWPERNSELEGFPDLSGCGENLISLNLKETNLDATEFPQWLVDGTCPNLDSIILEVSPERTGIMEGTTIFDSPWGVPALDNFTVRYLGIGGSIPTGMWDTDPNKIDFGVNKFTSIGRTDLTNLTSMSTMRYYRNDVEGEQIPLLDWSRGIASLSNQWNQIRFEENRYVFRDFLYIPDGQTETAIDLYKQLSLTTFTYGDQKPAGTANSYDQDVGTNLTISDFLDTYSHADNVYQWQKNGSNISNGAKYSGVDTRELAITNIQTADEGTYELLVTNPGLPELTLTSQPIDMTVN